MQVVQIHHSPPVNVSYKDTNVSYKDTMYTLMFLILYNVYVMKQSSRSFSPALNGEC